MMQRKDILEASFATVEALVKEDRVNLSKEDKAALVKELREAISDDRVKDDLHITSFYRGTVFAGRGMSNVVPDVVVYPQSKDEVHHILGIASKFKVPVTVTFSQITDQTANRPLNGGIVIVTTHLNKIHKIDTQHGFAVIEPGVTVGQLSREIRPKGYTVAKGSYPAGLSVVQTLGPWLAQHNFCNRMNDQFIGLEMSTPDGSTIYTGNMVYGESELWTDVQSSCPQMTNLFIPQYATTGVITKAAIRIWPLLDDTALPVFGFHDFESAFRWSQAMGKSSMVDQAMVWHWTTAGITNFRKSAGSLDMMEARMKYLEDEEPGNLGMYNCYGFVQMRGYAEEVEGGLKAAKRLAGQYGGTYLTEPELEEKLPGFWGFISQWKDFNLENTKDVALAVEGMSSTQMFTGPTEELIKAYHDVTKKFREFGHNNFGYYTRVFNGGQTPWFHFWPHVEPTTPQDLGGCIMMMGRITDHVVQKYDINVMWNDFMFNDPKNPENVKERAKPIRRIMSAVQKEFDPAGIMTPVMKKYTLK